MRYFFPPAYIVCIYFRKSSLRTRCDAVCNRYEVSGATSTYLAFESHFFIRLFLATSGARSRGSVLFLRRCQRRETEELSCDANAIVLANAVSRGYTRCISDREDTTERMSTTRLGWIRFILSRCVPTGVDLIRLPPFMDSFGVFVEEFSNDENLQTPKGENYSSLRYFDRESMSVFVHHVHIYLHTFVRAHVHAHTYYRDVRRPCIVYRERLFPAYSDSISRI